MRAGILRALILGFGLILMTSCGASSPSETAEKYIRFVEKGQIEDAMRLFSHETMKEESLGAIRAGCESRARAIEKLEGIKNLKIVRETVIDEFAEISFEIEYGLIESDLSLELVKENGKWKLRTRL